MGGLTEEVIPDQRLKNVSDIEKRKGKGPGTGLYLVGSKDNK